jgi:hypothetical protein
VSACSVYSILAITLNKVNTINYCMMFVVICALCIRFEYLKYQRTRQYDKLLYVCCNLRALCIRFELGF